MMCSRFLSAATKNALTPTSLYSLFSASPNISVAVVHGAPSHIDWLAAETTPTVMELLNRNARRPKKANHGKRPCSHFRRRQKRLGAKKA
ncbi:hypothetical protein CCR75_008141 [Bremia lactucae]|uniref:Uncharacterized protein n=1 Tax=Bremia lactucae TaxID=4779 RepID=A0A976IK50_BRELC|nr:hypothetical protein CCR75_008141 [Bremia lactucae]